MVVDNRRMYSRSRFNSWQMRPISQREWGKNNEAYQKPDRGSVSEDITIYLSQGRANEVPNYFKALSSSPEKLDISPSFKDTSKLKQSLSSIKASKTDGRSFDHLRARYPGVMDEDLARNQQFYEQTMVLGRALNTRELKAFQKKTNLSEKKLKALNKYASENFQDPDFKISEENLPNHIHAYERIVDLGRPLNPEELAALRTRGKLDRLNHLNNNAKNWFHRIKKIKAPGVNDKYDDLGLVNEIVNYYTLQTTNSENKGKSHKDLVALVTNRFDKVKRGSQEIKLEASSIERLISEDLGTSLVHDYLVSGDNFNANHYAIERGFKSGSHMVRSLNNEQKREFKEAMKKVYETKYVKSGGKVNLSELCRKAGVSTTFFYNFMNEEEGGIGNLQAKLDEKISEEKEELQIERERRKKLRRRTIRTKRARKGLAAAAALALSTIGFKDTNPAPESAYATPEAHRVQFEPEQPQNDLLAYR